LYDRGHNSAPSSHKVDVNKGFGGDINVKGTTYGLESGESYYFNVDGKTIYSTNKSLEKFNFSFSSRAKNIEWGILGRRTIGTTTGPFGVTVTAKSITRITGTWRGYGGFLWWQ